MYRHFRLTPYTNHYKYSAFQDSRLEFVSLFPRVDTRLIPYIVKHTIDLRYLHTIYILKTILHYVTPNSRGPKRLNTLYIQYTHHTKHTPSFPFTLLFYPFYHQSSSFFFHYYSLSPHHNKNKNNTLTDNIHSPITIPPSHAPNTPNTLTTPHLCLNNLNQHDSVRKRHLNSIIHL